MMDTKTRILDAGEALMKRVGYAGFSYADVAAQVEIRKASIHHHFPTKGDLALAAVERYRHAFATALGPAVVGDRDLAGALDRVGDLFVGAFEGPGRGCLCGTLSADWGVLPEPVKTAVRQYWDETTRWIATAVRAERASIDEAQSVTLAAAITALFEGAMLSAQVHDDGALLARTAQLALGLARANP